MNIDFGEATERWPLFIKYILKYLELLFEILLAQGTDKEDHLSGGTERRKPGGWPDPDR